MFFSVFYYDDELDIENPTPKEIEEHEKHRVKFCNWVDFCESMPKDTVRYILKHDIQRCPKPLKDRLYYSKDNNTFSIYFYGRDYAKCDYSFKFYRK